jgi:sugar phosphate isomerase/epimerase
VRRIALDHLTAVDCDPAGLAQAASDAGCSGIGLFMQTMDVLPLMPPFDLYHDLSARQALRRRLDELGLSLDLAYPFTLTGRTDVRDFRVALECAADLGAQLLNVLIYDRDRLRRMDNFAAFCDRAAAFGHKVAVEFYPPSQIASLADGLALVQAVGRPGAVGVNVDLLHLMRSGGTVQELAAAPADYILYGQLADGPAIAPADSALEASSERLLPGEGAFDLAGFVRALPNQCPISVEIPRNHAVVAGMSRSERVALAVEGVRRVIGQ